MFVMLPCTHWLGHLLAPTVTFILFYHTLFLSGMISLLFVKMLLIYLLSSTSLLIFCNSPPFDLFGHIIIVSYIYLLVYPLHFA